MNHQTRIAALTNELFQALERDQEPSTDVKLELHEVCLTRFLALLMAERMQDDTYLGPNFAASCRSVYGIPEDMSITEARQGAEMGMRLLANMPEELVGLAL